jgi:phenylacetyl-CoA:acceptor oxidoreductase subunit 1
MVVDLGRCVGCQTCTIACKMENGLPPGTLWRTVLDVESGEFPDVKRQFFPLTCMHCADPPCHDACPTTATKVRADGIVWIDDDICIGCGSCVVACPYQARHLVPTERYYFAGGTPPERATYNLERVGICTKCHFCYHKFDDAPAGVRPGEDPAYTPACASSCIGDVIRFGDLEDPTSTVARMVAEHQGAARMLEHLDTQPSVYHLNVPRIDPRPPQRQHTWHGLAVANFYAGPTGAGLYLLATLAGWLQGPSAPLIDLAQPLASLAGLRPWDFNPQQWAGLLGPALVAVGLLSVAAEAGRPFRGFNVFRNLGRSWMSRESAFAMVFMALAVLDTLFWQNRAVQALAAVAGMGVALAQGLILSRAKGVPAWNVPLMPLYFITSALAFGAGALLVLVGLHGDALREPGAWAALGVVLALADLMVWQRYLATPPRTDTFRHAIVVLKLPAQRLAIEGLGHALPVLLLGAAALFPGTAPVLLLGAGLALLAGGLLARVALVLKAAFLVDLFDRFGERPAAGSASSAAPPAARAA